MKWFKELFDSVRGDINNMGEALADARAIPALEQKVRDAKSDLAKSKNALTEVMAQEKLSKKKVVDLGNELEEHEGYAAQADEQGNESLLNELIDKIADLDSQLAAQREVHDSLEASVNKLKSIVNETDRGIKAMDREVKTIKATEYAQKAAAATAAKHSGSSASMTTAAERMKRIKERQKEREARMEAAQELADTENGGELKSKLAAAGIGVNTPSRDSIRERIKARKSAS